MQNVYTSLYPRCNADDRVYCADEQYNRISDVKIPKGTWTALGGRCVQTSHSSPCPVHAVPPFHNSRPVYQFTYDTAEHFWTHFANRSRRNSPLEADAVGHDLEQS